jgi:amino acid adenylation domain-containing protein
MLLHEFLARRASVTPDAPAVRMGSECLSYGELETLSNRIARLLRDLGVRRHDRVCLLLAKSPVTVAAMLGALKADCVYVPLDLASPPVRLAKILIAADVAVAFANRDSAVGPLHALRDRGLFGDTHIVFLDESDVDCRDSQPLESRNSPDDPAHILFTSGSTGDPKGVVVTHRNVAAFVEWAVGYFGITASDRMSGHPPLHFDLSTFDIYGSLAAGAELHLVPPEANLLPHRLASFIRESQLTQWFSVPSTMAYLAKFDAVPATGFETLKRVIWCGEVLPTPVLIHWMRRMPNARFTNLYGPTETTIASSFHTVAECPSDEAEAIPIGQPCAGEELLILDEQLEPVGGGEIGELCIGGVGVTSGYWRDEERTRAAFVPDPREPSSGRRMYKTGDSCRLGDDGLVYFLGRNDSQVKSRGYRIELGEIEAALATLEGIRESAVVSIASNGFEGVAICCAFVPAATEQKPSDVRQRLHQLLPPYMLPSRWQVLASLPKNANGKIDRRQLREMFAMERGREGARADASGGDALPDE